MGRKLIDLTGQAFGRLTVTGRADDYESPGGHRRPMWACRCECGSEAVVQGPRLRSGRARSCGCLAREILGERARTQRLELNPRWVGTDATYSSAHQRNNRYRGPAGGHACVDCDQPAAQWSYTYACPDERTDETSGSPYCPQGSRHPDCYAPRCHSCHKRYDMKREAA